MEGSFVKQSKDVITNGGIPYQADTRRITNEWISVKDSKEVLKLQRSHIIRVSIIWLNMITMINDPTYLLEQDFRMSLFGLVLGFSKILDSKSRNMMHIIVGYAYELQA